MIKVSGILAILGTLSLSGCVDTSMDATNVGITGGNLTGTTATNCRIAIAQEINGSVGDVAIFDVAESEAGNTVQATVAGANAPWICRTSRDGTVQQVMFSGSEGFL